MSQLVPVTCILLVLLSLHVICGPPDLSLATIPVGYYGGQNVSHRSEESLHMLAKMRVILIEKWEGPCWDECMANSTHDPPIPCQASCGADLYQVRTMKEAQAINPKLSIVFYLNTLYDFGFITIHQKALDIGADVVMTNGKLMSIKNDNGMPHVNTFDQGKKKTRDMWLKFLADKKVDGVFPDKTYIRAFYNESEEFWQLCESNNDISDWDESCGEISEADAKAYNEGKDLLMDGIYKLFGKNGVVFFNTTRTVGTRNYQPAEIIEGVKNAFKTGATYVYLTLAGHEASAQPGWICSQRHIIMFLLAVEEGCILGCNGWDPQFDKPLGNPLGPATVEGDVYTRKFASGTSVTWNTKTDQGEINWSS